MRMEDLLPNARKQFIINRWKDIHEGVRVDVGRSTVAGKLKFSVHLSFFSVSISISSD